MKIVTLTVNPAIDVHLYTENLIVGEDNPARLLRRDSGGKGVNISRALTANGIDNLCYMILGECGCENFVRPLKECGMTVGYVTVDGFTRENINIHSAGGETVIAAEGAAVNAETFAKMRDDILEELDTGSVLCFAGRFAKGMEKEQVITLLLDAKKKGARLVMDSKSLGIDDYKVLKPYLIKPNKSEAQTLLGIDIRSVDDSIGAARRLCALGIANVIITLGADGAVYSGAQHLSIAVPIPQKPVSEVRLRPSEV